MFGYGYGCGSFWWIVPLIMVVLCFIMFRRRRWPMMCGFGGRDSEPGHGQGDGSAMAILDKRFAMGEIEKEEYEARKATLSKSIDIRDS